MEQTEFRGCSESLVDEVKEEMTLDKTGEAREEDLNDLLRGYEHKYQQYSKIDALPIDQHSLPMGRRVEFVANQPLDVDGISMLGEVLAQDEAAVNAAVAVLCDFQEHSDRYEHEKALKKRAVQQVVEWSTKSRLQVLGVIGGLPEEQNIPNVLFEFFLTCQHPNAAELVFLSTALRRSENEIRMWFAQERDRLDVFFVAADATMLKDNPIAQLARKRFVQVHAEEPRQEALSSND